MKKLIVVTLLFLFSATAHADVVVAAEDGHLYWSSDCASSYKFSYFDSNHIQRACVVATNSVPLKHFVTLARENDCYGQVRVDSGLIREGVLYANEISKVWGCPEGGSEDFL